MSNGHNTDKRADNYLLVWTRAYCGTKPKKPGKQPADLTNGKNNTKIVSVCRPARCMVIIQTMKLLTKESDYAIRALLLLARRQDQTLSSKSIADAEKIPLQFLRRILQTLKKAGILSAKEGMNGGVSLARQPCSISLGMIITLFQGNIQFTECLFRKKLCHNRANCVLRHRIMAIEQKVADEFSTISIGTLLEDLKKHEA